MCDQISFFQRILEFLFVVRSIFLSSRAFCFIETAHKGLWKNKSKTRRFFRKLKKIAPKHSPHNNRNHTEWYPKINNYQCHILFPFRPFVVWGRRLDIIGLRLPTKSSKYLSADGGSAQMLYLFVFANIHELREDILWSNLGLWRNTSAPSAAALNVSDACRRDKGDLFFTAESWARISLCADRAFFILSSSWQSRNIIWACRIRSKWDNDWRCSSANRWCWSVSWSSLAMTSSIAAILIIIYG